jgi:hypothetical protein
MQKPKELFEMVNTELIDELINLIFAEFRQHGVQEFLNDLAEEMKRVSRPTDLDIYTVFEQCEIRHIKEEKEALKLEEYAS